MKFRIKKAVYILLAIVTLSGCDKFKDAETDNFEEIPKDLSGLWRLVKVTRNGIDITGLMDFSRFSIDLKENGEYVIENYLPFVVEKPGKWQMDDPLYPFHLIFKEEGSSSEGTSVEIKYPIVGGKRSLSINLSPGCFSNSYTYVFDRTDNQ